MGRIIEGFWDCEYCGTKGIRGSIEKCPKCGGVHNTENGFYLKPNELNYVPEEEAKNINRNPDWVCDFCGNLNSDDFESCPSCGAPRTKENLNYFESRAKKEKEKAEKELQNKAYSNTQHDSSRENEKSYAVSKPSNSLLKRVLIVLASILLIAGIIFVCIPKEQEIHVQEVSWEYSINIEEFKTVTENDIYLPTDARLLYTTQEIAYYEDVLDHYETKTREVQKERIVGYE